MQGRIQEIVKGDPVYPVSKGYVCRVNMRRAKRSENYPLAVGVENIFASGSTGRSILET